MKPKNILNISCVLTGFIFILYCETVHAQPKPFDLRFVAHGPFPINYDAYINDFPNANITIRNKTSQAYEFEMYSFIVGPYGISGESKTPHCTKSIGPNSTLNIPRGSFEDLCINYRIEDFTFDQIPGDLQSRFLLDHILPEGEYEICIQAKEIGNPDNVYGSVCFKFNIVHPSRPVILQPTENAFIDATTVPTMIVSWTHAINNPIVRANTTYNVKIIDLGLDADYAEDPNSVTPAYSPYELIDDPGVTPLLFLENVKSPYNMTLSDLNFIHGHNYAVCVYAANDQQPLGFDLVRSDIKIFQYFSEVELVCGTNIAFDAVSPTFGYYVPFTRIPLVMKFSPYCDKYTSFEHTTILKDETSSQILFNYHRTNNWNYNAEGNKWKSGGPRRYFNYVLNDGIIPGWDPDAFYSSHLALCDLASLPLLTRGHSYSWTTTGAKMTYFRKPTLSTVMTPVAFKVGMPAPAPNSPSSGSQVDTGIVSFNMRFDDIPPSSLPPFKIVQIIDGNIINYTSRSVNEFGVIQVSKNKTFSEVLFAKGIQLQFNENDFYDDEVNKVRVLNSAKLNSQLYADVNFTGRFVDTATYYWRLGWYNNPDAIPSENTLTQLLSSDFYNISIIDSFKIGNDTAKIMTSPNAAASTDTLCGSSCTIALSSNTTLISGLSIGDEILIGKFLATLTEVSKSGSGYSGKSRIKIPFLHNVTVKTSFTNLKVNTDKLVFEGEMNAESGGTELESIANVILDQPMQLPLGWDATVKGRHTILALTAMKFLPTRADMTASINFGDLLPEHMALPEQAEMSGTFCFHPGGFSETMIFHLSEDMTFDDNSSGYGFLLKGGAAADTTTMCYIKWDCKGFSGFQVAGDVLLSESLLNKDSGLASNDEPVAGRVKAGFKFKYIPTESALPSDNGFIFQANIDAFQFKDFSGWGFDSDTMYIDWSDSENPPGFTVPHGYSYVGMDKPETVNGWEGLYIPRLKTFTPKDFGKGVSTRTVFSGSSLIFGEGKYYVSLMATNIFNDSWARMRAKMDTIQGVISSDEKLIRFKGGLLLPFTDTTSWIDYGGHFSGFDSIHLYVSLAGDSVHLKDLPVEFRFDQTSLLNIVRGADHTFRANAWFNGYMDLETNAGFVHSSLSSLNFKGIKFENLGYKSGAGFDQGDFSLASPQKTMNGFPIQLDSIDFVSEGGYQGFYLKPKIVLVGDVNGFSAEAGLNLLFKFDGTGSYDKISESKIDLKDVGLDVAVSGFELKGRLAFINTETNKGMEGILAAKLPGGIAAHLKAKFGTVTTNANASFNTATNYSYWYVDGMVTFGNTGIPMFAGTNLYGIGGGLWYHMTQKPITNKSYAGLVGAATDTANINYSGIGYEPNFNSNYGMKLQGLFGSQNEGKTFNMLLAVWAQFNAAGGPNVGLDGDMRFMGESVAKLANGDPQTTKKSVWGDVHFVYNGQEHFVQGNLNAYVNVTVGDNKVFYGKLDGDKMVEAEFFAGLAGNSESEKWYLKIGTPEARAGAVFDLKIKKSDISAYLMVGHGLPNEVPQPDPGFMAMLNNAEEGYRGGDVSTVINKPLSYSATGIAAGVLIKDTFAFNFQPFYLDVNAIIGADINVTQDDEGKCRESGLKPGVDGWYGTGQLYAGIKGSFGIYVDIWFIEGKFEFLEGSIALLMQGGLPNPSWFYAKGTMKYEVIGLIEGTHSMEINVGDKCTVGSGNPLSDMTIIQDLYPANGATDVSVYAIPKATISPAVNHVIELYDTELEKDRIFRVDWESKSLKKGTTTIPTGLNIGDGTYVTMPLVDALSDHTQYKLEIKVTGSEKQGKDGPWVKIPEWVETKTHSFTTGVMPDIIHPDNLAYTYPIIGQNYFLKDEVPGSKGYIVQTIGTPQLFYKQKIGASGRNFEYHYEARFYKENVLAFKRTITVNPNNKILEFNTSSLENNKAYQCKIVRVLDPSITNGAMIAGAQVATDASYQANTNIQYAQISNIQQNGYTTSADVRYVKAGEYDFRIIPQKLIKLNASDDIPTEHVLFEYRFKTSQYNTLTQKMGNSPWTLNKLTFGMDILDLKTYVSEPFDKIDLQGWQGRDENGTKTFPPLISFGSNLQYGEDVGGNSFGYLPFDAIAARENNIEIYRLPNAAIAFAAANSLGLKDAWNLTTLKTRFDGNAVSNFPQMVLFDVPIGQNPLSQDAPTVAPGIDLGSMQYQAASQSSTSSAQNSSPSSPVLVASSAGRTSAKSANSPFPSTPASNFQIRLNHGIQLYRHFRHNKNKFSSTISGPGDIMGWIKSKNASLESRLSYYILSDPYDYIKVECLDNVRYGSVYQYPTTQLGMYGIGSKQTINFSLPCPPAPQID